LNLQTFNIKYQKKIVAGYCSGSKCGNLQKNTVILTYFPGLIVLKLHYSVSFRFVCFFVWALVSAALVPFGVALFVHTCHTVSYTSNKID